MKALVAFAVRNRIFIVVVCLFGIAPALYFVPRMPVDVFPDINDPTVTIMTEAPGLPPEEVEPLVTVPIESALNYAPRLKRLRSSSGVGLSIVTAEFDWGTDILQARQIVAERLAAAAESLPEQVSPPVMGPTTSRLGEIMEYVLVDDDGTHTLLQMREIADRIVRPRLQAIPGVAEALHMGGDVAQFQILVDPQRLLAFGLTVDNVARAAESANVLAAGGYVTEGPIEYQVHGLGRAYSLEHFEQAVVLPYGGVPLEDPTGPAAQPITIEALGSVTMGSEPRRGAASFNGKESVLGKILKNPAVNTLTLTDLVLKRLEALKLEGVRIVPIYLQRDLIRRAVDTVLATLYEGAGLVVLVVGLFLFRARPTFIALTAIPLSMLLTLLILHAAHMSINIMTLGGLAIAVGMVVDDAIIDVENVGRRLGLYFRSPLGTRTPSDVIVDATLEIRNSIVFATAIIVLVFIPLLGLTGVEGRMFAPLGITVIAAMVCSLGVSLLVTPALCRLLLAAPGKRDALSPVARLCRRLYAPVLDICLRLRLLVAAGATALFILTVALSFRLGREFIPVMDEGALTVNALLAPGTSLDESFGIGRRIEGRLGELPWVTSVATRTGRASRDEHAEGVYYNELLVSLQPPEKRNASMEEIKGAVREKLAAFPGVAVSIGQPISHRLDHLLSGVSAEVAIKIFGPELAVLRSTAEEVVAAVRRVPGVADLVVEPQVEVPKLRIDLDRADLALYGFTAEEVVDFINAAFNGKVVGQVISGPLAYDVLLKLSEEARGDIDRVMELRLQNASGEYVPLKELASVFRRKGPSTILREDLSRRIVVQCNASGRDIGSLVSEIRDRVVRDVKLDAGYSITYGGQFESEQRALRSLTIQLVLILAGIFVLLFFAVGSIRMTLLVMLNLPLALAGGVASVYLTGGVVSVSSAIGFILLFGIAIRNGIILVGHIDALRAEGLELDAAIRQGAMERLNPVLMTALSTALGMLPLALSSGSGAEIQRPLATVILGGMISSTLLTLVVIPALYALVEHSAVALKRPGRELS